MLPSIVTDALPGVLVPATVCGALALVGARPWRGRTGGAAAPWVLAVALAAGYAAGHRVVAGHWPPLPFGDTTLSAQQWRLFVALSGGAWGVLLAFPRLPTAAAALARAALVALVLRAVLDARFRHVWSAGDGAWRLALLALGVLVVWTAVDRGAARGRLFVQVELWFVATGTAIAFQIAHNSSNAQLAGALAGALGAAAVATAIWPRLRAAPGGTAVAVPLLAAMLVEGPSYGEVPVAAAVLLGAVPLIRALAGRLFARLGVAGRPLALELLVVALCTAGGVMTAVLLTPERTPYLPG